jgi:hypothetical protein
MTHKILKYYTYTVEPKTLCGKGMYSAKRVMQEEKIVKDHDPAAFYPKCVVCYEV